MQFEWSDFHRDFRQRIREFLAAKLPPDWERKAHHGPGSEEQTHFSRELCGKSANAVMHTKSAMNMALKRMMPTAFEPSLAHDVFSMGTADHQNAMPAFAECTAAPSPDDRQGAGRDPPPALFSGTGP